MDIRTGSRHAATHHDSSGAAGQGRFPVARRQFGPAAPVTAATLVLLAVSPMVVGGSLDRSALATMLPFASFLALVAVGQTLVVQQGGLDFSVAGTTSLAAVVLSTVAEQDDRRLWVALGLVAAVAAVIGLANGILVTWLRVTPIIATLGVNALVLGAVREVSGGLSVPPAPQHLRDFALGSTIGIYNPVLVALAAMTGVSVVVKRTVVGRRFEVVGSSPRAARVAGIRVEPHQLAAYTVASLLYAAAGVMLAGYLSTPGINAGDSYLLSSIAAVVLAGTSLAGGSGSVIAAGVAALFLTQLSQLLLGSGLDTSVNFVVQGGVIAGSMAVRTAAAHVWAARARRAGVRQASDPSSAGQTTTAERSAFVAVAALGGTAPTGEGVR